MARLTMERYMQLQEMGREPISLPESIYFAGNETLQKTPGNHHLPQFRKTGTYNHPSLKAWRKRVATDRAKRLINNKMPEVELRKIGGMAGLQKALAEFNLTIDAEQMEVAMMNAKALEEDGNAKTQMREEQKMMEMARLGIKYVPIEADKAPMTDKQLVNAVVKSKTTKVKPVDDLSSLKGDDEKDGNKLDAGEEASLSAANGGVVDTGDNIEPTFVEKTATKKTK